MGKFLQSALDWSEIWALLIPLLVLLFRRKPPRLLKPVVVYLWLALGINFVIDMIWVFKEYFPGWLQSNNPFYNLHAVARFACFSIFFMLLPQPSYTYLKKMLLAGSVIFILVNFIFLENFFNIDHLSGNLLASDA